MKLLIIDDHPVVRHGLGALFAQSLPDAAVLLACSSEEGLGVAELHADLDVVFLDLAMPGLSGMAAIKAFGEKRPALPIIVLSSSEDPEDVRRALALGALGYVPKSAGPQTIVSALRLVLAGEVYIPAFVLSAASASSARGGRPSGVGAVEQLTARQKEVLTLLAKGLQNKEIGDLLGLADKTVKTHITAIFKTLNVINRTQAATIARECHLV